MDNFTTFPQSREIWRQILKRFRDSGRKTQTWNLTSNFAILGKSPEILRQYLGLVCPSRATIDKPNILIVFNFQIFFLNST